MNSPDLTANGIMLWDGKSDNADLFLQLAPKSLFGEAEQNFLIEVRALRDPRVMYAIRRSDLEELLIKIQTSLLLVQMDPSFAKDKQGVPYNKHIHSFLQRWEKRFSHFLKESSGNSFRLI